MTVQDWVSVIASKASVVVSMKGVMEQDGRRLASAAATHGVQITMKEIGHFSEQGLRGIASGGKGCVTFDFTA